MSLSCFRLHFIVIEYVGGWLWLYMSMCECKTCSVKSAVLIEDIHIVKKGFIYCKKCFFVLKSKNKRKKKC